MTQPAPTQKDPFTTQFALGCGFWILFGVVAVFIRGIRWDENYEFAQAMTGLIPYDDGHPLRQYTRAAYNLQFYTSALILKISDNPVLLNGIRSLLFNIATVLPVFMLGAWISRRIWIAHASVIFILIGIHLEFDGVYPQFIWPGMFSNGHIGMAYVLIFAGALAAGHLRTAALLLGLMPAIHLGQMPPAILLTAFYTLHCAAHKKLAPLKNAARWCAAGLLFCATFYIIQQQSALPPVTDGPYYSDSSVSDIWQGRITSNRDMHRSIPTGNIHIITIATLLISIGGWRFLRKISSPSETAWLWLTVYAHSIILITYTTMALHYLIPIAGGQIPYLLLGWLPYRLMNHLAPILIVMCVTLVSQPTTTNDKPKNILPYLLPTLLLFHLAKPLYPHIVGEDLYFRYLLHNDSILFVLIGAAAGVLAYASTSNNRPQIIGYIIAIAIANILAIQHQFGAACLNVGIFLAMLSLNTRLALPRPAAKYAAYAFSALILIIMMKNEFTVREHLPIGAFEAEVTRILEEEGKPHALIASHPDQILLQAQTGHPVVTDMATEFHASYKPSLGPSIQKLYEDVYGTFFEIRDAPPPSWIDVWNDRTLEEWADLREQYNIEYLIAPNDVHPQAPLVHRGGLDSLYRLP